MKAAWLQGHYPWLTRPAAAGWAQWKGLSIRFTMPGVRREITRSTNGERTLDDWVDFLYHPRRSAIRPLQVRSEIRALVNMVGATNPKRILEIGTFNGGSLFLWCRAAADNAVVVSVDLPGVQDGAAYPEWARRSYRDFASNDQHVHVIAADSHDTATVDGVSNILKTEKFDFIFIDGDHTYSGVAQDFEMYRPLLRNGGMIAFHDILPNSAHPTSQVDRYWQELRGRYHTLEIVEDPSQGRMGIGVVWPDNVLGADTVACDDQSSCAGSGSEQSGI